MANEETERREMAIKDIKTVTIVNTFSPKAIAAINRYKKRNGIKSGVNAAERLIELGEAYEKKMRVMNAAKP